MEICVCYDRAYIKELLRKSNLRNTTDLGAEAIALLEWALNEVINGRIIVALDVEADRGREILAPSLEYAKTIRRIKPVASPV